MLACRAERSVRARFALLLVGIRQNLPAHLLRRLPTPTAGRVSGQVSGRHASGRGATELIGRQRRRWVVRTESPGRGRVLRSVRLRESFEVTPGAWRTRGREDERTRGRDFRYRQSCKRLEGFFTRHAHPNEIPYRQRRMPTANISMARPSCLVTRISHSSESRAVTIARARHLSITQTGPNGPIAEVFSNRPSLGRNAS